MRRPQPIGRHDRANGPYIKESRTPDAQPRASGAAGETHTADPRYRFLARFGATILSGGIAAIPMALYYYQADLRLTPQEVWFVGYILAHRWTSALPYPSLRQMSRRTGMTTQMLHRYKQSLVEKGYLATIARHRASGGRTSNAYDFSGLFGALEQLLMRDRRDAAWSPTVDGGEDSSAECVDDAEPVGAPLPSPHPVLPESQRQSPVAMAPLAAVAGGGSQRALTPPTPRVRAGAGRLTLLGGGSLPLAGPANAAKPQESRITWSDSAEAEADAPPSPRTAAISGGVETTKRSRRNAPPNDPASHDAVPLASRPLGATGGETPDCRWLAALAKLSATLSAAAFQAWIAPLQVDTTGAGHDLSAGKDGTTGVASSPAALPTPARVTLVCASKFQRDHVAQRYQAAIEAALGSPVEIVFRPATAAGEARDVR